MSEQTPKALKIVVISMGVMLLGGFVWVAAVVASRAGEEMAKPKVSAAQCQEITLPQLKNAKTSFEDGEWVMQTRNEIRRYSECGELLQRATFTRD